MAIKLSELLAITMDLDQTKNLLGNICTKEIKKYQCLIETAGLANIEISTYEEYKQKITIVIDILSQKINHTEYLQMIKYRPVLDELILETFKLLV